MISSIYTVFSVKRSDLLMSDFLFMYFNRPEFDRFSRFNSWGSARETFDWNDFCDIEIDLPPLSIQQKYVDIYNAMLENQKNYERGLDDLKLVCDAYIEDLRRNMSSEKIEPYIQECKEKNNDLLFGKNDVLGVSKTNEIIETKAIISDNDLSKFTIIRKNDFVYNPRYGAAIGLNKRDAIISWNNTAFRIKNEYLDKIVSQFLFMYFCREEWARKAMYDSWGSSTEVYALSDLLCTEIPIPDIKFQNCIVDIYNTYDNRKNINDKLKSQIKDICPILIKGSIEEARKEA